jgi:hypothetical protein
MIKFNELKKGDHVIADYEGDRRRGEVEDLNNNEKQVQVNNGVQSFWYETDQLTAIPLNEDELLNFKFHKQVNEDGTIKYLKGAFRILISKEGDFSRMEIWYRDEQRHITEPIMLHTLQNHFYEMTKVFLNEGSFD